MKSDANPEKATKAAFLALRDEWLDYVNQASELSHATARLGTFIALRMNARDQSSWWSVGEMARKLGMSTRTISDGLVDLRNAGLLVVHRPNRRGGNFYFLRLPY